MTPQAAAALETSVLRLFATGTVKLWTVKPIAAAGRKVGA